MQIYKKTMKTFAVRLVFTIFADRILSKSQ